MISTPGKPLDSRIYLVFVPQQKGCSTSPDEDHEDFQYDPANCEYFFMAS